MTPKLQPLVPGVDGLFVPTTRFKTTRISVHFFLPLSEDTISANTILPCLLTTSCKAYPDYRSLHQKLNDLYGAGVSASSGKMGDNQVITLSMTALDDSLVPDGNISGDCAALLAGMIFAPHLDEKGHFLDSDIQREKRLLLESIQAEQNDKRAYAIRRAESLLCQGQAYAISRYGTYEGAQALTEPEIRAAWNRLLQEAYVRVIVVGSADPEPVFEVLKAGFAGRQTAAGTAVTLPVPTVTAPREELEEMDVAQGKLVLGFETGVTGNLLDTAAFSVMVDLFGGGPYSRLFTQVREKLSLCYYCAARANRQKGYLLVDSGVEKENANRAKDEILRQLEIVRAGEFEQSELDAAILGKTNRYRTMLDTAESTDGFYLSQVCDGTGFSLEEILAATEQVTRADVVAAAQNIRHTLTYFLSPKGGAQA